MNFFLWRQELIALCCVFATIWASQIKAQQRDSNTLPLPQHAIWRFGAMENSNAPGYYRLKFSPDGKYLAARNRSNKVEVRNCETKKLVCELGGFETKIIWLDFSPDSQFLLTAGDASETVKIWDIQTGRVAHDIECKPSFVCFGKDQKSIMVLERKRSMVRRKIQVDTRILKYNWPGATFVEHIDLASGQEFHRAISPSSRFLVAAQGTRNNIWLTKLVDLVDDSSRVLDGPADVPNGIVFSPDENWVVAKYNRKDSARLWNLNEPAKLKFQLKGHTQTIKSVAFSDDSRFLVTTGWDRQAIVWDLLTREPIGQLRGHGEHVVASAFRPHHFQMATASTGLNDSTVIVWDLNDVLFPRPIRHLAADEFGASWRGMAASKPETALANLNNLLHSTDVVFDLLEEQMAQPMSSSRDQILEWIRKLDSTVFIERELATRELKAIRGAAEGLLLEELAAPGSTERYYRIKEILKQPLSRPAINAAEMRRLHRGIMLLELIVGQTQFRDRAIQLLESLAQNHPHSDISRDAAAAISRINFRAEFDPP